MSSPRIFLAFSCTSKELMEIPHVIRRTAITAGRRKAAFNHREPRDENFTDIQAQLPFFYLKKKKKLKTHLDISYLEYESFLVLEGRVVAFEKHFKYFLLAGIIVDTAELRCHLICEHTH